MPASSLVDALPSLQDIQDERARRHLAAFTVATHHDYAMTWYHQLLADTLTRFAAGELKRVMVLMPPRHGKSEQTSRRLPAFILGRNPDAEIIACSYSADLAQRINRDVQRVMEQPAYRRIFPGTQLGGENIRTVTGRALRNSDIFEIIGHRGAYRSAGVGGGITGMGMDFGIIDDPVKNREDADSRVKREALWEWYTSTFYTRLSKGGGILVTLTRWHEDDLAGRLLSGAAEDDGTPWTVLRLPAVAGRTPAHPLDPRAEHEALWPGRFPAAHLADTSRLLGSYQFSALFQQQPVPAGGAIFKREWFPIVDAAPAQATRARGWDAAGTEGGGDYTAGVKMARDAAGLCYIEHVVRGQWSSGKVDAIVKQTAQADSPSCRIREEQEPGSSGKAVIASRTLALAGYDYQGRPATGEKSTRWRPFAIQAEAGNVRMVRGDWNQAFLDELVTVPAAAHDDQADAAAIAFSELTLGQGGPAQTIKLTGY